MFCIAAFIVLLVLSIFSARYRKLLKKAWGCVGRRMTLRPCDSSFKEDIKNKMLARVANKTPRLVTLADAAIEVGAVLVIVLTVWSLYVVVKSGLNLYVYDTCNPSNAAACSLGAEACSIATVKPSFIESAKEFKLHVWFGNEFKDFGKTVAAVPSRMQTWRSENYLPAVPSYWKEFESSKPTAVEVIDPGCQYCRELYKNQKAAGFADRYNVTYIPYPIKDSRRPNGYKFRNSLVVTQYLEAIRRNPLQGASRPADWQILDRIFTGKDEKNVDYQIKINSLLNEQDTAQLLDGWLQEFGYSPEQISAIRTTAASKEVGDAIQQNRKLVEDRIKTVKIPTIIFDGRRHDGALPADKLR